MEYRLLKDWPIGNEYTRRISILPKGTIGERKGETAPYYFDGFDFDSSVVENNPEWFERVIDWTKEKYFRNGYEDGCAMTKGKIYPINKIENGRVYFVNDYGGVGNLLLSSMENTTPATEAEYLEQEKNNILWYHDFRDAKVGDKVYNSLHGEGNIAEIDNNALYPIRVKYINGDVCTYCKNGRLYENAGPTLYKSKPTIIPPERPKKKVKKSKTLYCNFYKESSKVKSYSSIEEAEKMSSPFCDVIAQPVTFEWEEDA